MLETLISHKSDGEKHLQNTQNCEQMQIVGSTNYQL